MKVLLFSNDTMPFGSLPTSGGGLRCWHLYQGLLSQGIEVVASMPAFTYLTKKYFDEIPEDVRDNLWEWHTQDTIYQRVKPDAVLFASNWDHYNLSSKPDVPLIIDLHGSRLIETAMWGAQADTAKKVDVFSKADCLLTAGKKQRNYFYGWLLQAGRIVPDEQFIRHIPVSLAPERFNRNIESLGKEEAPLFVSGGGWFPWQDQSKAIFSICSEITKRNAGTIKIYGTPHDNSQSLSAEELHIRGIFQKVKELSETEDRIQVQGYVGRDDLLKEYARASVAVELMQYNLERELAFTTRTIEYLWCGLPVIYNDYAEISDYIRDYDAGWAIDPMSDQSLDQVLQEIFRSPETISIKSKNAQHLVGECFSWDKTIAPLCEFLSNPSQTKHRKPTFFSAPSHAPFLYPSGLSSAISLHKGETLEQEIQIPAEGVWGMYCYLQEGVSDKGGGLLRIKVYNSLGLVVASKQLKISEINEKGAILIPFLRFMKPRGGSILRLKILLDEGSDLTELTLLGLAKSRYPLLNLKRLDLTTGASSKSETCLEDVIKIDFMQGPSRLLHYSNLVKKGFSLLRDRDWVRLKRGIKRRSSFAHLIGL